MADVVSLKSVGCAYQRGVRMPGWGSISLDDGTEIYVPESDSCFDAMCAWADSLGHTTVTMRKRLDHWVKTGAWI